MIGGDSCGACPTGVATGSPYDTVGDGSLLAGSSSSASRTAVPVPCPSASSSPEPPDTIGMVGVVVDCPSKAAVS